jgi:hypothetical protein
MQAAKARLLALKASACKKDRNTHDRERSSHASTHARQHEFCWLWLDLDMDDVVPEWMHVLDLNDAFLFFKHVTLKHCDPFTREWVAHFHTGQLDPTPTPPSPQPHIPIPVPIPPLPSQAWVLRSTLKRKSKGELVTAGIRHQSGVSWSQVRRSFWVGCVAGTHASCCCTM